MAKDKKVEQITNLEDDFAQWYTDICRKAELVEYASVKGFTILRPYGFAIWENMQRLMDAEFKKTGHENVAMPVLIPESLLKKEGELVNGFAPEVAWVTMGGSEKLEERLAFRPTSETMFCDHWSRVLQTYRQLPMLYNQWCSVIRWEKTTRPFLRSREFWWQEGHTIHETAEEGKAETEQERQADGQEDARREPQARQHPGGAGAQLPELFHFIDSFRPRRADCACIFGALMLECTCSGNICTSLVNRRSHIWHSFRNTISWRPRRCRRFFSRSPRQSGCWRPVRSQR